MGLRPCSLCLGFGFSCNPRKPKKGTLFIPRLLLGLGAFANVTSLATGSFFSEGERWKRERRILSPAFNAKNVESLIPAVQCVAEQLLQEIEKDVSAGKEVDLTELMPLYTADVICKTGLGHELNLLQARSPDLIDDMKVLADAVQTRMFAPFPYWKVPGLAPWIDDGDKMKKKFDQRAEETMKLPYPPLRIMFSVCLYKALNPKPETQEEIKSTIIYIYITPKRILKILFLLRVPLYIYNTQEDFKNTSFIEVLRGSGGWPTAVARASRRS